MQPALDAAAPRPEADPNPRVGCVVIDAAGRVVGAGHHRGAGTPHAEVDALAGGRRGRRGGTRPTSPSSPATTSAAPARAPGALLDAGVAPRRSTPSADPDPAAAGERRPAAAGVDVEDGPLADEAEALNATWLHARRTGRPWVDRKTATTLDGRTAAADGTEPLDHRRGRPRRRPRAARPVRRRPRRHRHRPRRRPAAHRPRRPTAAPAARPAPARRRSAPRPARQGARLLDAAAPRPSRPRPTTPPRSSPRCRRAGIHHVLLEGGPTLAAAFLRAGLVDEVVTYVAPALLGAAPPPSPTSASPPSTTPLRLETTDVTVLGGDVRITARPLRRS